MKWNASLKMCDNPQSYIIKSFMSHFEYHPYYGVKANNLFDLFVRTDPDRVKSIRCRASSLQIYEFVLRCMKSRRRYEESYTVFFALPSKISRLIEKKPIELIKLNETIQINFNGKGDAYIKSAFKDSNPQKTSSLTLWVPEGK